MGFHAPLSVLIIGGIVGILVFAVSSAFTVWFKRNQSAAEPQGRTASLSASLLKLALLGGLVVVIVCGFNALQSRTVLEQEGPLVGKDLFTVRSRAGFTAAYPPPTPESTASAEYVEQGRTLVILRRSPDPKEMAAATLQRDILQEQLNFERTQRPPADPTLQNQLDTLDRRLDMLHQRQKELINQRESVLSEEAKSSAASQSDYRRLEQQAVTLDAESKQTAVSLHHAEMEMRAAAEMLARGLISQQEQHRRQAAYEVLQSQLAALRERRQLLEREQAAIRTSLLEVRQRTREQLAQIEQWLREVEAAKQQVVAEHAAVSKRLLEANVQKNEQHLSRLRQLELQLAEVHTLLASPASPTAIEVTAPWSGYVGYRDLSPASLRPDAGPLVVMYKPDHLWVAVQVPMPVAQALRSDQTSVKVFFHSTSPTQVEFSGHLKSKLPLPDDQHVELRIGTVPPAALIRKLALGEDVQARVHISSEGMSIDRILQQISVASFTRYFSSLNEGLPFVSIIAALGLLLLMIMTLRHRRTLSKAIMTHNSNNHSLIVHNNGFSKNNQSSYTHSYTNETKPSNLLQEEDFIYDFTNDLSDTEATSLDISHQDVAHAEMHDKPDQRFHDWWVLGRQLDQSIRTNAVDTALLAHLQQQLEHHGLWVIPFIASALSSTIQADLLLSYSLQLCVKRLSEVHHEFALGQAMGDLARDLCIVQRFFPALFKQIIPNLQQGLTMALHLATAEGQTETDTDTLLAMLREVFTTVSNNRQEASFNVE